MENCKGKIVDRCASGDIIQTKPNSLLSSIFGDAFVLMVSGFADGETNMRTDIEYVQNLQSNATLPILRLYGWKPWAVSIGFHQSLEHISIKECNRKGIEIVRRPTGGRAVLHANEVTYSIITYCDNQQEWYKNIHTLLLGCLQSYSSEITFEKNNAEIMNIRRENPEISKMCFSSSARYELKYRGKKIVGSAQRMYKNVLLQHGSILLDRSHESIFSLLNNNEEVTTSDLHNALQRTSTNLKDIIGRPVAWDNCVQQITSHIYSILP